MRKVEIRVGTANTNTLRRREVKKGSEKEKVKTNYYLPTRLAIKIQGGRPAGEEKKMEMRKVREPGLREKVEETNGVDFIKVRFKSLLCGRAHTGG